MDKYRLLFDECEHDGDLDMYEQFCRRAGLTILDSRVMPSGDRGEIIVMGTDGHLKDLQNMDEIGSPGDGGFLRSIKKLS